MPQQLNVGEVDLIAYSKSVLSNSTDSDDGVATMIAQIILLLLAKATGQSPRPSKSVSTIHWHFQFHFKSAVSFFEYCFVIIELEICSPFCVPHEVHLGFLAD
jgi:hypothetical protein